jgi:hypothetical protein
VLILLMIGIYDVRSLDVFMCHNIHVESDEACTGVQVKLRFYLSNLRCRNVGITDGKHL